MNMAKDLNLKADTLENCYHILGAGITQKALAVFYNKNKGIRVDCNKFIDSIIRNYDKEKNNLDKLIDEILSDESIYTSDNNVDSSEVQTDTNVGKEGNGGYDLIEESLKALTEKPKKPSSKKTVEKTAEDKFSRNITDKHLNELIESVKNIENKVDGQDEKLKALDGLTIAFDGHNNRFKIFNEEFKTFENDINNFAIKKDSSRFGFYCLLTLLSMLFYIAGSTSYFFFDAIVYPKLHAYMAGVSIPLLIIGVVIGILYKPIFIRIFRRKK